MPLFREQIRAGGPVTVTHPEITRYFMTIPEACQLILQAAVLGNGGEVFALDMGEPVRIRDLAEQMIRLAGKIVGRRHPDHLHRPASRREAVRGAVPSARELQRYDAREDLSRPAAQHVVEPLDRAAAPGGAAVREYDEDTLRRVLDQLLPEFAAHEGVATPKSCRFRRAKAG